jgi:hypothetical protein
MSWTGEVLQGPRTKPVKDDAGGVAVKKRIEANMQQKIDPNQKTGNDPKREARPAGSGTGYMIDPAEHPQRSSLLFQHTGGLIASF